MSGLRHRMRWRKHIHFSDDDPIGTPPVGHAPAGELSATHLGVAKPFMRNPVPPETDTLAQDRPASPAPLSFPDTTDIDAFGAGLPCPPSGRVTRLWHPPQRSDSAVPPPTSVTHRLSSVPSCSNSFPKSIVEIGRAHV